MYTFRKYIENETKGFVYFLAKSFEVHACEGSKHGSWEKACNPKTTLDFGDFSFWNKTNKQNPCLLNFP